MMNSEARDASQWLYHDDVFSYATPIPVDLADPDHSSQRQGRRATCEPYTIMWSLCKRKSRLDKLTEGAVQNIEQYPSDFWDQSFRSEIEAIVAEKKLNDTHEPDETRFMLSINARGVSKIPLRSPGLEIDWRGVEKQIDDWSPLVQNGKSLTLQITFVYKESARLESSRSVRRGRTATITQLNERAAIHNDHGATDEIPIWEQVYDIFECPGSGCDIGPYCWLNEATGVRYPVSTNTLLRLVEYVEKGGTIREHRDVPKHLQNEIMGPSKKRKQAEGPQISVTNVMPGAEAAPPAKKLRIAGPRDKAIDRYRDLHCEQVVDLGWKEEFHAIASLTFEARLSLDRLFEAQEEEAKFFISQGISRGIAYQWVSMVDKFEELGREE